MRFFDSVVGFEVREELRGDGEELFEGGVCGASVVLAGCGEEGPGFAEVVMLPLVSSLISIYAHMQM